MRSLPRVVSAIPNDLRAFVDRVREYLGEGSGDRFVTLNELRKGGIVGTTPGGTIIPPGDFAVQNPGVPTNLVASGAFAIIFLEWDAPNYLGHAYTEVWAADTDDFSAKVLVGTTGANVFGHDIGTGASKYYWIRFVNTLGTVGPFNDTLGTLGATSQDPDYLIDVLSDAYGVTGDAPFFQIDTPTVINGVTIPAGTYIKQAWIADATISRAKIQDLAVDNAKINDLDVNKLTAGTLQVGSYIQSQSYVAGTSGWKINSDGSAEFSNVTVRGTVAGSTILGGSATTYSSGTGLFAGLDSGTYKFRVGNPSGNRLQWTGSALNIVGAITGSTISGSELRTGSATAYMTGAGFWTSGTQWRVGDPAGSYIRWTGSALEVNGAIVGTTNIQQEEVNRLSSATNTSAIDFTTGDASFTVAYTVATVSSTDVPALASGVVVSYSLFLYNDAGNSKTFRMQILRGSTVIDSADVRIKAEVDQIITRFTVDKPSAGTYDYSVVIRPNANTTAGNLVLPVGAGTVMVNVQKR